MPAAASKIPAPSPSPSKADGMPYYRDVHMDTAKGFPPGLGGGYVDVHMGTAKGMTMGGMNDVTMETARGGTTLKQGGVQRIWERELLESAEVKRKSTVAQLCW